VKKKLKETRKVDHNIDIIYEDDNFFAINKPFGIVVNDCDSQKDNITVQSWAKARYPKIFKDDALDKHSDFYLRAGVVHRLDKQTTGVLLIAKDEDTFLYFTSLFSERAIKKEYIAIVYGAGNDFVVGNKFIVDAPIARNPQNRIRFAIVEGGRPAITEFKVLDVITHPVGDLSVVKCLPKTGRTHQIRVHLSALSHPIVGDDLYSGQKRYKKNYNFFKRQLLHARKIIFNHPISNKPFEIESPVPLDIQSVLDLNKS